MRHKLDLHRRKRFIHRGEAELSRSRGNRLVFGESVQSIFEEFGQPIRAVSVSNR